MKYSCSSRLMEAVRKLDYKGQYKVCEAFFNMMMEEEFGDDSEMGLRFHDTFEEINPRFLESDLMQLHFAINDMDMTNDKRMRAKTKAVYSFLGVKTRVVSTNEYLGI